jgi:RNA polymerase sigma-70 factor (ECF subfamily)
METDDLVERSRNGDMDAFAALVARFHGEVRGWAAIMAVAADGIDDVAQEVFIEAHRALPRYDASRPFPAWLRGIARNVVRRHVERKSRDGRLRLDELARHLRERESQSTDETAPEGGALERLRSCLDRLPEHLRTLLTLRYAEEKSSGDIASLLKRSADAVRMSLMRTRDTLIQCMEQGGRG